MKIIGSVCLVPRSTNRDLENRQFPLTNYLKSWISGSMVASVLEGQSRPTLASDILHLPIFHLIQRTMVQSQQSQVCGIHVVGILSISLSLSPWLLAL